MSRGSKRSRRRRSGGTLETGLGLAALGVFLLLLPVFMNSPLQQSALEPLEPMGWIMLLIGVTVCAWCFRPLKDKAGVSESLSWLSASGARQPSNVTPDRDAPPNPGKGSRRGSLRARRSAKEPADDAARRAALKAAVKANVAKMSLTNPGDPRDSSFPSGMSDTGFADTVLAMLPAHRRAETEYRAVNATPGDTTASDADADDFRAVAPSGSEESIDASVDRSVAVPSAQPADDERERDAPPTQWNPRVFQLIEWRRFEAVIEALFIQAGFLTRPNRHPRVSSADNSVDIWLYSRHARKAVTVVKCRHSLGRPVSAADLVRFYDSMSAHDLKRGTYATTSTFTPDAQSFAADYGIHAMDGAALLELIATRTSEQQDELLKIAFEGEYWRPTCPNCGIKLVRKGNAQNGSLFWGCLNLPACRVRMPITS